MVVWVDAAAEDSTIRNSNLDRNVPNPCPPKTAGPSTDSTSEELLLLPSPIPVEPVPAKDWAAKITSAYVTSSRSVEMIAARPGVLFRSAVSSLTATAVSQPQ